MVKRSSEVVRAVLLVLFAVSFTACSTPRFASSQVTVRKGLFDRSADGVDPVMPDYRFRTHSLARSPWAGDLENRALAAELVLEHKFQWPVKNVEVTSFFGKRGRVFHDGIDLRASPGTSVFAARGGTVLHSSGSIRGYGKLVVIRHSDSTATIYAHNSRLLVRKGQLVKQGQKIALSGRTGRCRGPHVHFEIRRGLDTLDPIELLPPTQLAKYSSPDDASATRVR